MLLLEISGRNSIVLRWRDEAGAGKAICSRLDLAAMLCFLGDARISNRGFAIRNPPRTRSRGKGMEGAMGRRRRRPVSFWSCAELLRTCTTHVNVEVTDIKYGNGGLQGLKPLPLALSYVAPEGATHKAFRCGDWPQRKSELQIPLCDAPPPECGGRGREARLRSE